tara:strand:- start:13356 stop:13604 length:249 start_codon:yes stop_codon:yes gene_type:complete
MNKDIIMDMKVTFYEMAKGTSNSEFRLDVGTEVTIIFDEFYVFEGTLALTQATVPIAYLEGTAATDAIRQLRELAPEAELMK